MTRKQIHKLTSNIKTFLQDNSWINTLDRKDIGLECTVRVGCVNLEGLGGIYLDLLISRSFRVLELNSYLNFRVHPASTLHTFSLGYEAGNVYIVGECQCPPCPASVHIKAGKVLPFLNK